MALERQVGDGIDATLAADLFIPAGITEKKEHFRKCSTGQEILYSSCCKYISFTLIKCMFESHVGRQLVHHHEQILGATLVQKAVVTRQKLQETQHHKIESGKVTKMKERKKRCMLVSCSPHIVNLQGGFSLSQGSLEEPLA